MAIYVSVCEIVCVFQLNYLALPKRCFCIYTYGNFCQIPAFWLSEPCRVSPRGPAELCVCPCSSSAAGFDVRPEPPPSLPLHLSHTSCMLCHMHAKLPACCVPVVTHTDIYIRQISTSVCVGVCVVIFVGYSGCTVYAPFPVSH